MRDAVALLVERGYEHQQIAVAVAADVHTVLRYRRLLEAEGWTPTVVTAASALEEAGLKVPDRATTPRGTERSAAYRRLIGFLRGRGHEQQEIADILGLNVGTVRTYQRRLEASGWTPEPRPDPAEVLADHGINLSARSLGDETREMVTFLTERGYTQEQIGDALGLDRASVAYHQSVLRDGGQIAPRDNGPEVPIEQAIANLATEVPERATPEQRIATAEQIMRYRAEVVAYLAAVVEKAAEARFATTAIGAANPAYRLRAALLELRDAENTRASADDLGTPQPIRAVELWRQAAVAAVAGRERDLPTSLTRDQRAAALRDTVTTLRALVALDERYAAARGWKRLPTTVGPKPDEWALPAVVLDTAAWAADAPTADYAIDRLGPPATDRPPGPPPATFGAAAAALDRAAAHLAGEPEPVKATVMRWLVDAQRRIATYARHQALNLDLDEVAGVHEKRYHCYDDIDGVLTDVASTAGCESVAVVEIAEAGRILKHTRRGTEPEHTDLTFASQALDATISRMLRLGAAGYYFQRTERLAVERPGGSLVRRAVAVYEPITPENNPGYAPAWLELERVAAPREIARSPEREAFTARLDSLAADTLAVTQARNHALYPDDDGHRVLADHASAEVIAGIYTLDAAGAAFTEARARLVGALAATNGTLAELGNRCGLDPGEIAWLIEPARAIDAGTLVAAPERGEGELAFGGAVGGSQQTELETGRNDQPGTLVGIGPASTEGPGL
ncbi:ArsR family transcriptional regulator [Isoptericola sp. S6320L]|uniref:ArsR family transcriptional regulator n=1 Tax=Isoptericola sp. S6320L TaxID=2926411 RepID=UPI001FF50891|nr:ArsR family transcriptional regulator [Isoptericola sp. S6320L]MCK0117006.1 ArsR family transcriptional regulator [Isoptericola sp. S6320L]